MHLEWQGTTLNEASMSEYARRFYTGKAHLNSTPKQCGTLHDERRLNQKLSMPGVDTSQRMVLEPRILLDAAGVETADAIVDQVALEQAENWQAPKVDDEITLAVRALTESDDALETASAPRNEIVFIDSAVEDMDTLLSGIDPSIEVIILDADKDGVEQIASVLEDRENLDAVHIISHGRSGTLDLGNAKLTEASMNGRHADEMQIIQNALSENSDILIYGCDFGAHARGASAVETFAELTGADVAASIDLTGAANLGGDWELEVEQGVVETSLALSARAQTQFSEVLTTVTIESLQVDTDGDGVNDFTDIDDDNDGILDADEGFVPPAPNLLTNNSFEELGEGATTQGPFFGGGFNNFGSNVVDWDLVAGTADVYYPSGTTTVNGSNVPAFSISDVTGGFEPGPSAGDTYAAFHSGDGLLDAPGELGNGREVVIHNLSTELVAGNEYILTFDVFQADGLIGSGGTGGFEVYTLDTGSVQNNNTAWQDGTTVGGLVNNTGANGLNFVGLTEDITANGTPASGTAANGAAGWQTITVSFTPTTNVDRIVFTPESGLHIYYGFDNLQLFEVQSATGFDSDGDGIANHLDIDSDNDGITDNIEAQSTAGYIAPNNDSMATLAANRGLNSAFLNTNTGGTEGLAPVNTDNMDVVDFLDTDSDNEGANDTVEAGLTGTASGLSTPSNDADGDGLFDIFDGQNGTSINDGFVANEGITTGATALPDGDNDAAGGVPLVEDVDFRDAMTVLPNEAPSIDLDVVSSIPTPGQDGFVPFSFSPPIIENDGQSELADGIGNGETALYENVGIVNGASVDLRAVVVENINANPTFGLSGPGNNPTDNANVNMNSNSPNGTNISTVRWELIDSATGAPVVADFTLLITDLDAAGNQNNGFRGERISISEDAIDAFVLNEQTDLTPTVANGILTFQPADADPGTPGQDETNAVQLVFSSTSSFEITYDRSGAANFTFDGNFTPIFTTPVTEDTNADFANIFTEGEAPVNIAAQSADVDDFAESDITLLEIEPGNIADGVAEVITFNGDNGTSISLPLDGSDTTQQSLSDGVQDNDPLIVSEVAGLPANVGQPTAASNGGQFTIEEDGSFSFDDNDDFEDLAIGETRDTTITYQISDGQGGFDTATITLTVTGTNDAPIVIDPNNPAVPPADPNMIIPAQMLDDSETSAPLDVSVFFDDVDNDNSTELTFSADNLPDGLTIDPDTGVITGMVDNSASQGGDDPQNNPGIYTVIITATDPEGGQVSTEVTYTVENPAPIAEDDLVSTDEDINLTGNVLEDNGNGLDTDLDGDTLVISQVGGNAANLGQSVLGSNGGLFTVNPDGSFEFVPGDDFNALGVGETATSKIEYEVSDGEGGTDTATITVTVTGTNDGPIPIDPTQAVIDPNNPPQGVPFDPQSPFVPPLDPENYIPVQVAQDSAPISPIDLTVFFGDPDANDEVVISVDPTDLPDGLVFDPVTNTITGTPASDASQGGDPANPGTYTIPVTATDPSGETFTTNVTFMITNPPPTIALAIEDFTETVGNDFETETADNFDDVDGDDLTYSAQGLPAGLTIDPVTGVISGQLDPAAVVDAPNSDGIYTVTVTVDDGQGGVILASFTFTALDAFVPVSDQSEQALNTQAEAPLEPEENVPFILQALDQLDNERERREAIEQALFDADENGFPNDEYHGGHESIETIAGNTVLRTLVVQGRIYLEVMSSIGLNGWEIISPLGWDAYQNANLFVSQPSVADANVEVTLQNDELGVEVRIQLDPRSGKFDVLETNSIGSGETQASIDGFSKQVQALSDHHELEARNLLKAIG